MDASDNETPSTSPRPSPPLDAATPHPAAESDATDASTDPRDVLKNDPVIAKKLVAYAYKKTGHIARATDAAQEAVKRVLEGKGFYRWVPGRKSLLDHLADVVDTVVANENRRASTRRERPLDPKGSDDQPDSRPSAEEQALAIEEEQREDRLAGEVMMRVEKDPVIPRMLELAQDGVDDAAEQARILGCSVKDIYRARERLVYHRDAVLELQRKKGERP